MSNNQNTQQFEVGDLVFVEVPYKVFQYVSEASLCWSNHVGMIIGHDGQDYIIAESTIPLSRQTRLTAFVQRSRAQRYEIRRLQEGLSDNQKFALISWVFGKLNIPYHTGFKLNSRRQFCSKFVYELYRDAISIELGKIETFSELLQTNPQANLTFWRVWFFGNIPWQRKTVTPASLYYCPKLVTVYHEETMDRDLKKWTPPANTMDNKENLSKIAQQIA